jgi:hypothetical protein
VLKPETIGGIATGFVIGFALAAILFKKGKSLFHLKGVSLMYKVKADNPDVGYSVQVGEVTDSEGNPVPDAQVSVDVASDNSAAVEVLPSGDGKSGTISFWRTWQCEHHRDCERSDR